MRFRCGWILLPVLLLAGCTTMPPPAEPVGVVAAPVIEETRSDDATRVLAYYAQVRQLSGPEMAREHESARRALAKSRSDINRLRYALLLSLPGAPAGEDPRELLEPVARSGESSLRGLAALMMTFLQEQRRLETSAQSLQQKLDALLTLERNMTRDGSGTRKR